MPCSSDEQPPCVFAGGCDDAVGGPQGEGEGQAAQGQRTGLSRFSWNVPLDNSCLPWGIVFNLPFEFGVSPLNNDILLQMSVFSNQITHENLKLPKNVAADPTALSVVLPATCACMG